MSTNINRSVSTQGEKIITLGGLETFYTELKDHHFDTIDKEIGGIDKEITNIKNNEIATAKSLTNLDKRISANTTAIATINGEEEGSIIKTVEDAITNVIGSAPPEYDTLGKVANYIVDHASDIQSLQNDNVIVKGDAENSAVLKGGNNTVTGNYSAAIGYGNTVNNDFSIAFGYNNEVKANCCFSDGSNNKVSGENSHAEGLNTKSGVKGFYFKGIDIKNKKIYLSTTKPDKIKTSGFASSDFENINFPYDIQEDMLSIINGNIYYDCLKVTQIKNKSVIYVESLPFTSVAEFNELFKNSNYTIFCLAKYKLGAVSVSFGCHSEGYETRSFGFGSHSDGYNTIAKNVGEHASGIYNVSNSDTQFSIGIGTSDTDRKNAFEVKQNGDIYINGLTLPLAKLLSSADTDADVESVWSEVIK